MLHTTFNLAKRANACDTGIARMRAALGPDWADDAPIPLTLVIEHSGIADAIWALCCTLEPSDKLARLFAADCAERVLSLFERRFPDDAGPRRAIETARRFALASPSAEELAEARVAARAAAAWAADAAADAAAAWAADAAADAAADVAPAAAAAWAADAAADVAPAAAAAADVAPPARARKAERQWQAQRLREMLEAHGAEAEVIA